MQWENKCLRTPVMSLASVTNLQLLNNIDTAIAIAIAIVLICHEITEMNFVILRFGSTQDKF